MNNNTGHVYVCIMAGGVGSRFWPLSRSTSPKQFLDVLNTGRTLIQSTFDRFATFVPAENIFIVIQAEHLDIVRKQLPSVNIENILMEPCQKNTAACVAFFMSEIDRLDSGAQVIITPSDHQINSHVLFREDCEQSLKLALEQHALVIFGVKPTSPETGYGYIECRTMDGAAHALIVERFIEKPPVEEAVVFYQSDNFLWNAGIIVAALGDLQMAFQEFATPIADLFAEFTKSDDQYRERLDWIYGQCPSVSIDKSILEKAGNLLVYPVSFEWSDLGTWGSVYKAMEKDESLNAVTGAETVLIQTNNCMISTAKGKMVMIEGLQGYIVVDTGDVLLICSKQRDQEIKTYLSAAAAINGGKFV